MTNSETSKAIFYNFRKRFLSQIIFHSKSLESFYVEN